LDGKPLDRFTADDGWEGKGNRVKFDDRVIRGAQDFGFSADTANAGGKPGEIGGVVWRGGGPAYYGDRVGPLSLKDHVLSASGAVTLTRAASDSGVCIGWFDSASRKGKSAQTKDQERADPPKNQLGIMIEGPSRIGHYFRPIYGTSRGDGASAADGPVIHPDGKPHRWSLRYDPAAAGGRGRITVTLDGAEKAMDLEPGHKEQGATFDRFGIFNPQHGGQFIRLFLDDLTYTASPAVKDP
jgi:hypothetical protein